MLVRTSPFYRTGRFHATPHTVCASVSRQMGLVRRRNNASNPVGIAFGTVGTGRLGHVTACLNNDGE
jgi:hypothetical protein